MILRASFFQVSVSQIAFNQINSFKTVLKDNKAPGMCLILHLRENPNKMESRKECLVSKYSKYVKNKILILITRF